MKKTLVLYNLLLTGIVTVAGLVSSQSPIQTAISLAFAPISIYFAIQLFKPGKNSKQHKKYSISPVTMNGKTVSLPTTPIDKEYEPIYEPEVLGKSQQQEALDRMGVSDANKRIFLKFIGTSSLSLFLLALFTKRAQAAFFGSAPTASVVGIKDSSGNLVDPAEKQPTDGYEVTEIDDTGADTYYGFVHQDGAWYITQESSTGAFRYVRGSSDFSTAWTDRAIQSYDYFDSVF